MLENKNLTNEITLTFPLGGAATGQCICRIAKIRWPGLKLKTHRPEIIMKVEITSKIDFLLLESLMTTGNTIPGGTVYIYGDESEVTTLCLTAMSSVDADSINFRGILIIHACATLDLKRLLSIKYFTLEHTPDLDVYRVGQRKSFIKFLKEREGPAFTMCDLTEVRLNGLVTEYIRVVAKVPGW